MNITLSLPSVVRISCIATSDPSASPSGFSWVTTTSLGAPRSSSSTSSRLARSPFSAMILPRFVAKELGDPHPAVHRFVVLKGQRRRVLERQLRGQHALQEPVRGAQAREALGALLLVSENAHIYLCVA